MPNRNFLSYEDAVRIGRFVSEETRRQGDGPLDVGYMLEAWYDAIDRQDSGEPLTLAAIIHWGKTIDPEANSAIRTFRTGPIFIGWEERKAYDMDRRMEQWLGAVTEGYFHERAEVDQTYMTRVSGNELAYKEFEEIHPFWDGNGRTGKIIFNWLEGRLRNPHWPYNFWGVDNP